MLSRIGSISGDGGQPRRIAPQRIEVDRNRAGIGPGRLFGQPVMSRKKRKRQGTGAIQEIRKLQSTTDFLIPKLPFARVVKDICSEYETVNK